MISSELKDAIDFDNLCGYLGFMESICRQRWAGFQFDTNRDGITSLMHLLCWCCRSHGWVF